MVVGREYWGRPTVRPGKCAVSPSIAQSCKSVLRWAEWWVGSRAYMLWLRQCVSVYSSPGFLVVSFPSLHGASVREVVDLTRQSRYRPLVVIYKFLQKFIIHMHPFMRSCRSSTSNRIVYKLVNLVSTGGTCEQIRNAIF